MKITKKKVQALLFFTFIFSTLSIGQINLGAKINLGVSKFVYSFGLSGNRFTPSGSAGFYYEIYFKKQLYLGGELLFNQQEGLQKLPLFFTDSNGQPLGERELIIRKHVSYTSVPIYLGLRMKNVSFRLGIQPSILIAGSQSDNFDPIEIDGMEISSDSKNNLFLKQYDFGGMAGMSIQLTTKIALDINYYYGFINIYPDEISVIMRPTQATIGVKYKFKTYNFQSE